MKKRLSFITFIMIIVTMLSLGLAACRGAVDITLSFIVDGEVYHTINTKGDVAITLPDNPTKDGYVFDGWALEDGRAFTINSLQDTQVESDLSVYAKWRVIGEEYQAPTYTITFNSTGGSDVVAITEESGESITAPTTPTKEGYVFDGWYTDNNTFLTAYTFAAMPAESFTLYAKWIEDASQLVTYIITFNSNNGSDVASITKKSGESITAPTPPTKTGYDFDGWYTDNDRFINKFTFTVMPDVNFTLYAKWQTGEQEKQNPYYRIDASGESAADGEYILFGEYPQTIKSNDVKISTARDNRGYYLGSDGYYYAKVTATPWLGSKSTLSSGSTVITEAVYYFKVELIKWRILEESDGTALMLCESIIANRRYNESYYDKKNGVYANNYAESEIRGWLNNEFYNTAFSALQQDIIQITNVDNSADSTGLNPNSNACANTNDKIFLPSYREMLNENHGFNPYSTWDKARERQTSDYSRATGLYMHKSDEYYGNGFWLLRSPINGSSTKFAWNVSYDGRIYYGGVGDMYLGVVPALVITLF